MLTIVAEADDDDYWFAASRDGNREAHYRGAPTGCRSCCVTGVQMSLLRGHWHCPSLSRLAKCLNGNRTEHDFDACFGA